MAKWIRNGDECSECGFLLPCSAEYYEWIEQGDHGYLFKNYAIIPAKCPKCHNEMVAVVYEGDGHKNFAEENQEESEED